MLEKGMRALVTGGSGGIGSALVRMLAAHGVHAIALSNNQAKLAALADIENVETVLMDVTDAGALNSAFSGQRIDILVNAAGVLGVTGTLYSVPNASAQHILDVNVIGVHNALSAVVPGMVERNRGHIVNVGSLAGPYPSTGQPVYSASKAAIHNMSANLRMELFGTDVRVTEIRPGRVRTGMHAEMFGGDHSKSDELLYDPYECLQPQDIADAIQYVLSTPPHVCVAQIEVVPTHQVVGGTKMFQRQPAA
ncbi:SDR family oxidoreductase [Mesorhizobium comanense]|jgi:NADP-dependent 3-hydroxy acid dehydrogenase YdfG|uniref:SDR family oxidoreductase n=1 Tax=Mesorhizobium comanense TaxID=2502215 RepID=UPI0010F8518A|nr:SDR family oxidoreductase [Mesorhizobium comanense]